ncbi:MAG TPA: hypothetical protein ENJ80_00215 [Gammaproteobacteria bacterium]|nr:hypothetical protein [Gammaproteobacteria bacterium]
MKDYLSTTLKSAVFTLASFVALPAFSVTLSGPGTADFALPGTTAAAQPDLGGLIIEDVISDFSISGAGETLQGTIQNRVVRGADDTLTFYWRIRPISGNGDILSFRVGGFGNFALDANWRIDGLGAESPNIARYFGDGSGAVNFLFENSEVGVGTNPDGSLTTSVFFFLDTEAKNYTMNGQFDLLCAPSSCVSQSYPTFSPSTIPVPAAAWLFVSGLLGLTGLAGKKAA